MRPATRSAGDTQQRSESQHRKGERRGTETQCSKQYGTKHTHLIRSDMSSSAADHDDRHMQALYWRADMRGTSAQGMYRFPRGNRSANGSSSRMRFAAPDKVRLR